MENVWTKVVSTRIVEEFKLGWIIENFSLIEWEPEAVESPELNIKIAGKLTKWTIQVDPNFREGVSFSLSLKTETITVMVNVEFLLLNYQGGQVAKRYYSARQFCKATQGLRMLVKRADLQQILPKDRLTIVFNLEVPSYVKNCDSPTTDITLLDDLAKLRVEADFSDISIMVSGREFKAHKNILASRSPVFSTMFKHNMKETNSGKIEIEDTTPEIFDEFLAFLYTGKANIKDYARELFAAADKYDVKNLKASCENELIEIINKENCLEILVLSDLHSSKILKEKCLNFMVSTKIDVDKNELAAINNPPLMVEIVEALLKTIK